MQGVDDANIDTTRLQMSLLLLRALSVEWKRGRPGCLFHVFYTSLARRWMPHHMLRRGSLWHLVVSTCELLEFSLRLLDSVLQDRALVPQLCGGSPEGSVLVNRRWVVSETRA